MGKCKLTNESKAILKGLQTNYNIKTMYYLPFVKDNKKEFELTTLNIFNAFLTLEDMGNYWKLPYKLEFKEGN